MNIIALQHYCLYTYLIIPDLNKVFTRFRLNFEKYRMDDEIIYFPSIGKKRKYYSVKQLLKH